MDNYSKITKPANSSLATASLVLGIISVVFILTAVLPISMILGTIAIILAHLSHIDGKLMGHAKAGFITGLISLLISTISITVLVALFFCSKDFREDIVEPKINEFLYEYRETYGDDYSDDSFFDEFDDDYYDDDEHYHGMEHAPYNSYSDPDDTI